MELLCPAGSLEAVYSAVYNGADAIYLGFGNFNARRNAKEFTQNDLQEAISFCHLHGVLVYLTLNTLLTDRELSQIHETISIAVGAGIDAVIVQDIGLLALLRNMTPTLPLHASTQMSIHNLDGVTFCKEQGVCRVVLARELSKSALISLAKHSPLELEVFAHGALCVCYSGQCYMSALVGGRSGNRGLCAQPCRLPYQINQETNPSYPLSLKDLSIIDSLKELEDMGIACLKIEGRMKRPEYVAIVTKIYKTCLEEKRKPTKQEKKALSDIFSRDGFTDGYYTGTQSNMFGMRPEHQRIDKALLEHAKESYTTSANLQIPVWMTVSITLHNPISLTIYDDKGNTTTLEGIIPEPALHRAMTKEKIIQQLSKLGGTPLTLQDIYVEVEDGLSVPISALNALRRDASDTILRMRSQENKHSLITIDPRSLFQTLSKHKKPFSYTIQILSIHQLSDKLLEMAHDSMVYLPLDEIMQNQTTMQQYQRKFPHIRFAMSLPPVIWDEELPTIKAMLQTGKSLGIHDILLGNWGQITLCKKMGFVLHGDFGLGVYNSVTLSEMHRLGFSTATASFELNFSQIRDIYKSLPTEIIIYGRLPMMITEQSFDEHNPISTLTDRKGLTYPILPLFGSRSQILNPNTLYLADKQDDIQSLGLSTGRLLFTTESQADCVRVLRAYKNQESEKPKSFTKGLYYRKVE